MKSIVGPWIAKEKKYTYWENDTYSIWCSGIFWVEKVDDVFSVAEKAFAGTLNYNDVCGWFRIVFHQKELDKYLFFGDHTGSRIFFMDADNGCFSDSFLMLRLQRGTIYPDYQGVACFFDRSSTLGDRTVISGITKTEPDYYYCLTEGKIEKVNKNLLPFSEVEDKKDFEDVMERLLDRIKGEKVCAACTGGFDSRTIIAALVHYQKNPDLVVMGYEDNPDVRIARKIAEKTGLLLKVIHPGDKEENWLEKGALFYDGCYDAVLSYRHFQKARWIKENGYRVEFGGLGGEFTKGLYYTPVRWGFPRHCDETFYYEKLIKKTTCQEKWCGAVVRDSIDEYKTIALNLARKGIAEATMQAACNAVVYAKLRCGIVAMTNANCDLFAKVDPMMDRRLVAAASQKNHYSLAMNIWERERIAKYCPVLSGIETTGGVTCAVDFVGLTKDRLRKLAFYVNRILHRIRRKLGLSYTSANPPLWDRDYTAARNTTTWKEALTCCKKWGFVNENIHEDEIPLNQTGNILVLGIVFAENFESIFKEHSQTLYGMEE